MFPVIIIPVIPPSTFSNISEVSKLHLFYIFGGTLTICVAMYICLIYLVGKREE